MTQNTDIRAAYPNRMRKCNLIDVDEHRSDADPLEERDRTYVQSAKAVQQCQGLDIVRPDNRHLQEDSSNRSQRTTWH
jgi:hypothetical protein